MKDTATLYQYNACPFCWKVKTLLAYKKVPHQIVEVHPLNKKEIKFSKGYKKVPIWLEKNGEQVNDSSYIMQHIDALYEEKPVFDKSDEENKWMEWADQKLVRSLPPLIYKTVDEALEAFDYISKEEKFGYIQKKLIKYSGALVMNQVAKKSAKEQKIQDPKEHFKNMLKLWQNALGSNKFLGGTKPNGADLAVHGILTSIKPLRAFQWVKENTTVHEWYKNIQELF